MTKVASVAKKSVENLVWHVASLWLADLTVGLGAVRVQQPYFEAQGAISHQFPTKGLCCCKTFSYGQSSWTYSIGLFIGLIIGAGNVKKHEAAKYHLIVTTSVKLTPDHLAPPFSPSIHHNDCRCSASGIDHGKNTTIHSRGMLGRNTCITLAERRTSEGWQG